MLGQAHVVRHVSESSALARCRCIGGPPKDDANRLTRWAAGGDATQGRKVCHGSIGLRPHTFRSTYLSCSRHFFLAFFFVTDRLEWYGPANLYFFPHQSTVGFIRKFLYPIRPNPVGPPAIDVVLLLERCLLIFVNIIKNIMTLAVNKIK